MNFFNKYKDLFGVPNNTAIPQTKLSINNNLFIDKPFVPTYKQTLSINSKLRDLRKDYNQLEQQLDSINMVMKTPKRVPSRKGRQLQQTKQKDKILNVNNFNNQSATVTVGTPKNTRFLKHSRRMPFNQQNNVNVRSLQNQKQNNQPIESKDPFAKKRMTWLKDEQVNLNKHSQIDYIFNHKIKQQNQKAKIIGQLPIPKAQNFMFGVTNDNNSNNNNINISPVKIGHKNDTFRPMNRNRMTEINQTGLQSFQGNNKRRQSNRGELDYNAAVKRRQQAKKNVKIRRQKLGYLYRTSW